jgi:hypothetical protein
LIILARLKKIWRVDSMAVRKNIKKTTLRQYMKNTKANENSRLRTYRRFTVITATSS